MEVILIYNSYLRWVHILRDPGLRFPLLGAMGTSPLAGAFLKAGQRGPMKTLTSCIVTLQTIARPPRASCHLLYQQKPYREVRYCVDLNNTKFCMQLVHTIKWDNFIQFYKPRSQISQICSVKSIRFIPGKLQHRQTSCVSPQVVQILRSRFPFQRLTPPTVSAPTPRVAFREPACPPWASHRYRHTHDLWAQEHPKHRDILCPGTDNLPLGQRSEITPPLHRVREGLLGEDNVDVLRLFSKVRNI